MGYTVDFDALSTMKTDVRNHVSAWSSQLTEAWKAIEAIKDSGYLSGDGADAIKSYYETVHGVLAGGLMKVLTAHTGNCDLYVADYFDNIDSSLHAYIKEWELEDYKTAVEETRKKAVQIDEDLAYVLKGIRKIFFVSYDNITAVDDAHNKVIKHIETLDTDIKALEEKHHGTAFVNTTSAIELLTRQINEMLDKGRSFKENFTLDDLRTPNWKELFETMDVLTETNTEMEADLEEAREILDEHDVAVVEERQKVANYIKAGVAVVGSVVLIVATGGAATPLVCAGVGAIVGGATAAVNFLADNYVKTGDAFEDINWSDFGQACVVGVVTGAISGAVAGASSMGSAIKQPIKNGLIKMAGSVAENAAEGIINTTWDVGEAVIAGKTGDEIKSIFVENIAEAGRKTVTEGAEAFVGGLVAGKLNVKPTKDKNILLELGKETIENAAEATAKAAAGVAWDVGEAKLLRDEEADFTTILAREAKEGAKEAVGDFVKSEAESIVGSVVDGYQEGHKGQNKYVEATQNVIGDTVGKTVGNVGKGLVNQGAEIIEGTRDKVSMEEIWEKDLKSGAQILEDAGSSASKHYSEAARKEEQFGDYLRKRDNGFATPSDGKVEVVVFDNYAVLKEDYDAAMEVAGKGAYKNMTAQDILGLPKKTNLSEGKVTVKTEEIDKLQKSEYQGRKPTNVTKIDYKSARKRLYTPKTKTTTTTTTTKKKA